MNVIDDILKLDAQQLLAWLHYSDDLALSNVDRFEHGKWSPLGGPFGAIMVVFWKRDGIWHPVPIGTGAGNSVVSSGIPTNHAENNSMDDKSLKQLIATLSSVVAFSEEPPYVVQFSNAQSCFACHAKQEILARYLINQGLLSPGRFYVIYGVDFDHTGNVAGFYDKPYAAHLLRTAKAELPVERATDELLSTVEGILLKAGRPERLPRAIVSDDKSVIIAKPHRELHARLFKPQGVAALHAACLWRKKQNYSQPWNLEGATLYILAHEDEEALPGILTRAEACWANAVIKKLIVPQEDSLMPMLKQEIIGIPNKDSASIILSGYNAPQSAIRVVRGDLTSKAQHRWAELIGHNPNNQYNGAPLNPEDVAFLPEVDRQFTAPLLG